MQKNLYGNDRTKVWLQKGKNLFDKNNKVLGALNEDGSVSEMGTEIYTTGFMNVVESTNYYKTISNSARLKFFDKDKKPLTNKYDDIANAGDAQVFKTPVRCLLCKI